MYAEQTQNILKITFQKKNVKRRIEDSDMQIQQSACVSTFFNLVYDPLHTSALQWVVRKIPSFEIHFITVLSFLDG